MAVDWIATPRALEDLIATLVGVEAYALDTEFHRERTYYPQLALLQLAWPGGSALVDPLAVDLAPLAGLFAGQGLAVLHAADQDLEVLQNACGTVPSRLFDTQIAAGFIGFSSASLQTLVERLSGQRLAKGDRLTDWMRRPLTDGQRRYAEADVAHLLALRDTLVARLEACDRMTWADEECELMRTRVRVSQVPETAWWRIKDSRSLRGSSRGVVQEVAAWRERTAASLDKPPRAVLPDLAVTGIAHRPPQSIEDLKQIRGLDGRHLKGAAAREILDAVERGLHLERSAIRVAAIDDLDRRLRPAVTLVSAWVGQLAQDLRIDASLLATRADLHALLRDDPDARLATGRRADLVGYPIQKLVGGDAALAFRPGRGDLVLEARSRDEIVVDVPRPEPIADAVEAEDDLPEG